MNNTIRKTKDGVITNKRIYNVSFVRYNNKLFRFGGSQYGSRMDWFLESTDIGSYKTDNISWQNIDKYKLKHPMSKCGYIIYKNFIITFGGDIGFYEHIDSIYTLNIGDGVHGWMEVPDIKCPKKSGYRAILTSKNDIHLFQGFNENDEAGHFSIGLSEILKSQICDNGFDNDESKCCLCDQYKSKIDYK